MSCEDVKPRIIKLLVLGDSAVGKTSLLIRYVENHFDSLFVVTIGVDFKMKLVTIDDIHCAVQIWDTAGQERFRTITPSFYRSAAGVCILYDITSKQSFVNISWWIKNLRDHGHSDYGLLLIGNKSDLEEEREVPYEEAKEFADRYGMLFFETSAKTANNCTEAIESLVSQILKKNPQNPHISQRIPPNRRSAKKKGLLCCCAK